MPPLPDVAKVLRCAMSGTIDGSTQWLTRFFIQYTGTAPTVAELHTFAGAIDAAWSVHLVANVDAGTELLETEVIDLSSPSAASAINFATSSGGLTGGPLPASNAMVVSYEVSRRYRGGHPRGYWRFGDDTKLADRHTFTSGFVSTMQTAIDAFFTDVVAAVWTGGGSLSHVNVSYYEGFTVVTSPTTGRARNVPKLRVAPLIDAVGSTLVRSSIGTQRRREGFIG